MKQLTLPPLFSNGMVIQRDVPFSIWGYAASYSEVAVTIINHEPHKSREQAQTGEKTAQAGADGVWRATLDPVPAGGPFALNVKSGEETITLSGLYSGDVWLCAGQSNMEMLMERLKDDFPEEWDAEGFPPVRQFKVPQEWDFSGPRKELSGGSWAAVSKETLSQFSGTAWFFAKNIYEKYRIPIGLVATAWGGTPVESWMSREALADFPAKIASGDQYADSAFCMEIADKNKADIQEWETRLLREDKGLAEGWRQAQTGISGWDEINLPGNFDQIQQLDRFCGIIWLARDFDVTADFAARDAQVWLGTIVDSDTVYINGVEAGNTGYRYPPRKYHVSAGLLHEGTNRIVIRVCCVNGIGGITRDKPFRIFSGNKTVELAGTWRCRIGATSTPRPEEFFFQRQPMGSYNAMIAPLLKFPFKGVIWYQGESNTDDHAPDEYAALFKAMVQDWRKKNERENLPFLFVQLPILGAAEENNESSSWAIIREAQRGALSLPATGMAAALDLGEWNDLHPLNKKDVGYRLFLAAERAVFGEKNTSPGPLFRSAERRGGKIFLAFENCGKGLCARETPYMSVCAGKEQIRLPVVIEKPDTVSVDVSSVERPEKILYAWANNPKDRQLYNDEGLPVIPFRVDIC